MVKFLPLTLLLACGMATASAQAPALKLRQVVIRAPDTAVAAAALEHGDDPSLVETLWRWVKEGKARVVSDVAQDVTRPGDAVDLSVGKLVDWPSERDQDFANLILDPVSWQTTLVGTSMKITSRDGAPEEPNVRLESRWEAGFSPRGPANVEWPIVWPRNKQPRVAWLDQPDFFEEKIGTAFWQAQTGTTLLGIVSPADALEPESANKHTSDVLLALVETANQPTPEADAIRVKTRRGSARLLLVGIGMSAAEASELVTHRNPAQDAALLDDLLKKVAAGKAVLRTCSAATHLTGSSSVSESGRRHTYPSEMPTIPSAWDTITVGTKLESQYSFPGDFRIDFSRHPALPRRAEWKCALDAPEMIMRQPQFFLQTMATSVRLRNGAVSMVGAMRTPAYLGGVEGVVPGEALLLFAKLDEIAPGPDRPQPDFAPTNPQEPKPDKFEAETIIFDLPASEEAAWKNAGEGMEDHGLFERLLGRVKDGSAKIAAHLLVTSMENERATMKNVEQVVSLEEGEPDYEDVPGRYRPTSCERHAVGALWEVEFAKADGANGKTIQMNYALEYDAQRPRHATLAEMIAFSKAHNDQGLPPMDRFQETWRISLKLSPGKAHFVGLKHPPGEESKDRLHVAFVKVRVVE